MNNSQYMSRYGLSNHQSRYIISPKLGQSSIIKPISNSTLREVDKNQISNQSDHLINLKKLYFMMLLYYLIALLILVPFTSLENFLVNNSYFLYLFFGGCLLLSFSSLFVQSVVIYLIFTVLFLLLFFSIKAVANLDVALMILFMFGGQVLAQFINVLQVNSEKELHFHQQSLFVLCSGLIVFQIFITSQQMEFFEMIIILITGILFGQIQQLQRFLLIIATQSIESKLEGNELMESVSIYCDVFQQFLHVTYNVSKLYYKDPIEVEIQFIGRNQRFGDNYIKMNQAQAKEYQHILISKLNGSDGLIGLRDGMFAYKKGRTQFIEYETEECTQIAIMKVE